MGDATGSGGRARERAIDREVAKAVGGGDGGSRRHPSAGPSRPAPKAPYVPSEEEKRTRDYGTPRNRTLTPAQAKEREAERKKKLGK